MSEAAAFVVALIGIAGIGTLTWVLVGRRQRPLAADASIDWPPGMVSVLESRWRRPSAALTALVAIAASFGGGWYLLIPTWQEVYDRNLDRIDAAARQFFEIASLLPPPGEMRAPGAAPPLDPLPVFDESREHFNTEIVAFEQLLDPSTSVVGRACYFSGYLSLLLHWRYDPPYIVSDKAPRDMQAQIEAALACRYLVVVRGPASGAANDSEVFVFDLRSNELLCQFTAPWGEYSEARNGLLAALRRATRGTFVAR